MILFAIGVGIVLYGLAAPDRATLGVTRGAAGAVRASIGSTPRPRSGPARSTGPTRSGRGSRSPRSTRSSPRSDRVGTRSTPTAPPRSRIARAIDGWIDGADGATRRRGEAAAALRRLRDRARDRRAVKQAAAAWDEAHVENDRRDRAQQRARISAGAHAIAVHDPNGALMPEPTGREQLDQQMNGLASKLVGFPVVLKPRDQRRPKKKPAVQCDPPSPPAPPATPNGAPVSDLRHIPLTELDHMTAPQAEAGAAYLLTEQIREGVLELNNWVGLFPERFHGATDLLKTGQMEASVALIGEVSLYNIEAQLAELHEQLEMFMRAMLAAQKDAQESDAKTGRVETAIPN